MQVEASRLARAENIGEVLTEWLLLPWVASPEAQRVKKAHPLFIALLPICSLESNSVLWCV